jgi:RNA polymerase sigma-70 factor (ECF subfamily)
MRTPRKVQLPLQAISGCRSPGLSDTLEGGKRVTFCPFPASVELSDAMHDAQDLGPLLGPSRAGDRAALDRLLARLRPYLHLLVRPQLGPDLAARLDSSDLVQESMMQVVRGIEQFQGAEVPQFLAWVGQIVARVVASSGRLHGAVKRDRRRETGGPCQLDQASAPDTSPQERAMRDEQAARLAAALEHLPQAYRDVIQGRFFDGLPFADIAARFGRSVGAVRVLCLRAVERLRQEMGANS